MRSRPGAAPARRPRRRAPGHRRARPATLMAEKRGGTLLDRPDESAAARPRSPRAGPRRCWSRRPRPRCRRCSRASPQREGEAVDLAARPWHRRRSWSPRRARSAARRWPADRACRHGRPWPRRAAAHRRHRPARGHAERLVEDEPAMDGLAAPLTRHSRCPCRPWRKAHRPRRDRARHPRGAAALRCGSPHRSSVEREEDCGATRSFTSCATRRRRWPAPRFSPAMISAAFLPASGIT